MLIFFFVHISCAGGKDSEDSVGRGSRVKRDAIQVLKVNRSSVKRSERGHKLTLFCGGSAEVSGTGPLQPSVRRQLFNKCLPELQSREHDSD